MIFKKLLKQYTTEQIAEAFVLPVQLTPKQQLEAGRELAEARHRNQPEMAHEQKLQARLLQLRFQSEDYTSSIKFKQNE